MVSNTITKRFETETGISYDSSSSDWNLDEFSKICEKIELSSTPLLRYPFEIVKKFPPRWKRKRNIGIINELTPVVLSIFHRSDQYLYLFISRGARNRTTRPPSPFVRRVLLAERCGVRYLPHEITGRWLIRSSVEAFVHANPSTPTVCILG